jgi:signal transduction histidine kinase
VDSQVIVTRREWALFGMRWFIPAGVLLSWATTGAGSGQPSGLILAVGLFSVVTGLIVLMLLLSGQWSQTATWLTVGVDVLSVIAATVVGGAGLIWTGLVPVAVTALYLDWVSGLAVGLVVAVGGLIARYVQPFGTPQAGILDDPWLILSLVALPVAGPLVALLSRDVTEMKLVEERVYSRSKRAEQLSKLATEYMRVVYELTDVLSASKLDPKRVLRAAVSFGLEGLERVGVPSPLYGAVLLFANAEEGVDPVLRIAQASMSVAPADALAVIPGVEGLIADALQAAEPLVSHAPDVDAELRRFESFGSCSTVVCLPLRSGNESYGVMLVGSPHDNAFGEMHLEMIRAVANQAASSLNNARLYGSLLEQRDRLVEVEKATRAQLAGELHDGPTQGVAAITMRLNYIRKLIEKKPERALEQGLKAGLEQLADKTKDTYDQNVELLVDDRADHLLDEQTTQTLFSIAVETVNNARKHAKADQIVIQLDVQQDMLVMKISDDGIGFDVEQALDDAAHREGHLGLLNLQERARLIEGILRIESAPGEGTCTTVAVPLEVVQHRKEEDRRRRLEGDGLGAFSQSM